MQLPVAAPPPVQVNAFYLRDGERTTQFWTQRYVPGPRYLDKPAYVLVSRATFSGGEEFAYDLQALGRATLIGETTAGGAHPVMLSRIDPHVEIMLPMLIQKNGHRIAFTRDSPRDRSG